MVHMRQTLLFSQCADDEGRSEVLRQGAHCLAFLLSSSALERSSSPQLTEETKENRNVQASCTTSSAAASSLKGLRERGVLTMSRFGKAVCESGMNPDEAILFYEDLRRAQDSLNLETDLHLIYLVAPLQHSLQPDFSKMWNIFQRARENKMPFFTVLQILEVDEGVLFKWQHAAPSRDTMHECMNRLRLSKVSSQLQETCLSLSSKEITTLCRMKRLWGAMAICDIFGGQSYAAVAKNFCVPVGDIESLVQTTSITSTKVQRFCAELGWSSLEVIIKSIREQHINVQENKGLRDLLRIPNLKRQVAQILFESDISTVKKLAESSVETVAQCFLLSLSFEFEGTQRGASAWEAMLQRARGVIAAASVVLTSPAQDEDEGARSQVFKDHLAVRSHHVEEDEEDLGFDDSTDGGEFPGTGGLSGDDEEEGDGMVYPRNLQHVVF